MQHILQTLTSIDLSWFQERLSLFSQTRRSHELRIDIDTVNGPDLFVTSWLHLGGDCAWNTPGTTNSIASAIRKQHSKVEGNIHLLPRSHTNDGMNRFKELLCLEKQDIGRVTKQMLRLGWLDRFVDA